MKRIISDTDGVIGTVATVDEAFKLILDRANAEFPLAVQGNSRASWATAEALMAGDNSFSYEYSAEDVDAVHIELESLESDAKTVDAVTLRVYGGDSQPERAEAADSFIDAMQEFQPPITCNAYECTAKQDASGNDYIEFRYFSF